MAENAAPRGKQKNDAGNQKVIERDTKISAMQKEKKKKENEATATEAQEMDLQIEKGLQIAQIEYNTGDINGPNVAVNKPKKRKWKLQARKLEKTLNCTDGQRAIKGPGNELHRARPNKKKRRVSSQTLSILTVSPSSKEKLKREVQSYGEMELETMVLQKSSTELETMVSQNSSQTSMRIMSWNVRGLGNERAFRETKKVLQMQRPQILFMCETKLEPKQMQRRGKELMFNNCFAVDRSGLGGVLALLWNSEVVVEVKSFSKHHIDAVVNFENGSFWRCTGVYGHPEAEQKHNTWTLLHRLASLSSLPWLCFGDFNEILLLNRKQGEITDVCQLLIISEKRLGIVV
ncbi:hypothetical protein WN943_022961 [Citrus x changshan-huyou]